MRVELSGVGEQRLSRVGATGTAQTGDERVADGSSDVGSAEELGNNGVVEKLGEAGGGADRDASGRAIAKAARASLEEADVGDPRVIAGDDDVHAVLESERDGVLEAKIELTVVDELFEAGRVGQVAGIHVLGDVGSKEIGERLGGAGKVEFRGPQRDRNLALGNGVGLGSGSGLLGHGGGKGRCGQNGG